MQRTQSLKLPALTRGEKGDTAKYENRADHSGQLITHCLGNTCLKPGLEQPIGCELRQFPRNYDTTSQTECKQMPNDGEQSADGRFPKQKSLVEKERHCRTAEKMHQPVDVIKACDDLLNQNDGYRRPSRT